MIIACSWTVRNDVSVIFVMAFHASGKTVCRYVLRNKRNYFLIRETKLMLLAAWASFLQVLLFVNLYFSMHEMFGTTGGVDL